MKPVPYPAPDFSLPGTNGQQYSLSDFAGKWVIVYFYPQDDTPGCTIEACSIRDARDELAAMGAEVIGISRDSASSHEKFKEKYSLHFLLLTDADGRVIREYGAWGKKMFGHEGVLRKTFMINPAGDVVKVFGRVTPLGHGEQLVHELALLQS